jgi:hypothetical protein
MSSYTKAYWMIHNSGDTKAYWMIYNSESTFCSDRIPAGTATKCGACLIG